MKNLSLKDCRLRSGLFFGLAALLLAALAALIFPPSASAQSETRIISVSTNLDFGKIEIISMKQFTLVIANEGNSDLTISNIDFPDGFKGYGEVSASGGPFGGLGGFFLVGFTNAIIPAGGQTNIFVIFTPTNVMHYGGTVMVTSDATRGQGKFTISGEGVYPTGRYVGLFSPDQPPAGVILYPPGTNGTFDNSGYFSVNVTANGGFSGTLLLAGLKHRFSGRLSSSGAFSGTLPQAGGNDLGVSFQIYPADSQGTISNQTWAATLVAYRVTSDPTLFPVPNDGMPPNTYHFRMAGSTNSLLAPTNDGTGTIQITASRAAHLKGTLGDGTAFSQETVLTQRNEVPLYALLYQRRGAVMGWVNCVIQPTNAAPGILPTNLPPQIIITNILRSNLPPFTNFPPSTNIVVVITPQSAPPTPPPSTITPLRNELGSHPDPIKEFRVKGTNSIYGSIKWFKPPLIDSNYLDGFSLDTTVNGPIN